MPRYSSMRRDQEGSTGRIWREGYDEGFDEGYRRGYRSGYTDGQHEVGITVGGKRVDRKRGNPHPKKRKLSAWNKFVQANSKKPRFIFSSGKLNLKKMGVAFRKTPAGKKK